MKSFVEKSVQFKCIKATAKLLAAVYPKHQQKMCIHENRKKAKTKTKTSLYQSNRPHHIITHGKYKQAVYYEILNGKKFSNSLATIEARVRAHRVVGQGLFNGNALGISIGSSLGHLHVLMALRQVAACPNRRQEIDHEGEDVAGEDKGNHPFENRTGVFLRCVIAARANTKANGKSNFDDDEGELDEEAG
jgi:hypothetical protein